MSHMARQTITSQKKEFYRSSLDQQEAESFEDNSLALVMIADRITQRDNQNEDSLGREVKERLTEGVCDRHSRVNRPRYKFRPHDHSIVSRAQ